MPRQQARIGAALAIVAALILCLAGACGLSRDKPSGSDRAGSEVAHAVSPTPSEQAKSPAPTSPSHDSKKTSSSVNRPPKPGSEKPGKTSGRPKAKPKTAAKQRVEPAAPTALRIPSIGVNAEVGSLQATVRDGKLGLYPPEATYADLLRAYWATWEGHRAAPGYPSTGTTFIVGHTCHKQGCPAVFNSLQSIQLGAHVTVKTPSGVLVYRIFRVQAYPKSAITNVEEVYANVPNRLVLVTCKLRRDHGVQTDNFVAWAKLVKSRRK